MSDRVPRLLTPQDLQDRSRYIVATFPVFGPNQRVYRTPDGEKVEINVTERDLPGICARSNDPWRRSHTPGVMIIGHRRPGYVIKEQDQPKVVGYSNNYRIAPLNGKPWIWADLYERVEYQGAIAAHPFRSAEYDTATKMISGVALLTQDPFLSQGVAHYQRGSTMPEPMTPEDEQHEKTCAYMKKRYPKMAAFMDDPSDSNVGVPNIGPESKPGNPPAHYQAAPEYQSLAMENARLNAERTLDALGYEGVRFDRGIELPKLVAMTPEAQTQHVGYMRANYQRVPLATGGGWIPTATAEQLRPAEAGSPLTPEESHKALAYQKAGMPFADAVSKVQGERTAKK